jgi:hypothetical protein
VVTDRTWRPSSRSQWAVTVATILVSAALAAGLPRVADATAPGDTAIAAGERVESQGVSVEVPAGWVMPGDAVLLVLDKGSANFLLFPPTADPTSPTDAVTASAALFTDAQIGEATPFSTESGLEGASIVVTDTGGETTMLYAISDGANLASGQASAPTDEWAAIEPEVQSMLGTIEITGVPSS